MLLTLGFVAYKIAFVWHSATCVAQYCAFLTALFVEQIRSDIELFSLVYLKILLFSAEASGIHSVEEMINEIMLN